MTKKLILLIVIFSFLFCATAPAHEIKLPEPGLTPDSPFYFLKSWKESIQTFFTFGAKNKAKRFLRLAEIRLAEYQKMVEKGKVEIAQKSLEKYQKQLGHALEKVEEVKEKGKDIGELTNLIVEKTLKHQEVLVQLFNKVPEQAKSTIQKAIEVSRESLEVLLQKQKIEKTKTEKGETIEDFKESGHLDNINSQKEEKLKQKEEKVKKPKTKAPEEEIEIEPSEVSETEPAAQSEEEKLTANIPNGTKNTTFVKAYRFYDDNDAWGIWQTNDNHYLLAGLTNVGEQEDAFLSKINQQGQPIWTKRISSWVHYSGPMGTGPASDIGYLASELKDGSYLLVGQTDGYVGDEEAKVFEDSPDVFLSKFSKDGKHLWTKTVGDFSRDTPVAVWPTNDNGFLLLLTLGELIGVPGAADVGNIDHYFALVKFDANGKKEWVKKTNLVTGETMGHGEQVNFFMEEDDSGFVLVGDIPSAEVSKTANEELVTSMPAVVKLDKNGNVIWAKTLEAIPQEYPSPVLTESGEYRLGYIKMRTEAGSFSAVQRTPDSGYLVFGLVGAFLEPSLINYNPIWNKLLETYLVAVKLDKNGNFRWAKTLKTDLRNFSHEFKVAKTKDNDFILMFDFLTAGEEITGEKYNAYMKKTEEVQKICQSLNCKPGDEERNPTLKQAYEEMNKAQNEWAAAFIKHIALIKVDSEFNVKWLKKIGPKVKPVDVSKSVGNPYQFNGNDIKIAQDGGILIAGTYYTDVVCSVQFGIKHYCTDALFIKLAPNGDLIDNSAGLVSDYTSVSQEDLSQYITLRDVKPKIIDYELQIIKRGTRKHEPDILAGKIKKITTLSPFKQKALILKEQPPISSVPTPQIPPQPKTWAERSYESVQAIEPINAKSQQIHSELLPILNQLFNKGVKLRDNYQGMSLDYTFKRLVTTDDVQAVKNYLIGLGYKDTDLSSAGRLVMTKGALVLNLNFSIRDRIQGTLEVTW